MSISFNANVLDAILKAKTNDSRGVVSANDASRIRRVTLAELKAAAPIEGIQNTLALIDPPPTERAVGIVGRTKLAVEAAAKSRPSTGQTVDVHGYGAPYVQIEGRAYDTAIGSARDTKVNLSVAFLAYANEKLGDSVETYVRSFAEDDDGPLTGDALDEMISIWRSEAQIDRAVFNADGTLHLLGSTEGDDYLPPTSFEVAINPSTAAILYFDDAD